MELKVDLKVLSASVRREVHGDTNRFARLDAVIRYIEGGEGTGEEWRAVIRGYDKLVMDLHGDVKHLYNLAEDPMEAVDLAEEPSAQLTRDALVALIRVWQRTVNDGIDPYGLHRR